MAPSSPQQVKIEPGCPTASGHTAPSLSTSPSGHSSAFFTQDGRHCVFAGPPPPQPEHLRPLVHTFDWEHLPALPAITEPSLAAVVSGHVTRAFVQIMKELAFEGHGVLCHASTQAVLAGCTESDKHEICRLHADLVSNVTLSHLVLSYGFIPPNAYDNERHSAEIFKAHIGALYREAKEIGKQTEIEALVAAMFCPEAWPVLERPATKAFWDTVKQASKKLDKRDEAKARKKQAKEKLAKEKQACLLVSRRHRHFPSSPRRQGGRWRAACRFPLPLL